MAGNVTPSANYKFNTFQEIKSHSSVLYNERMAILFYMLDMNSIEMNTNYSVYDVLKVKSILLQIYKNVRTLIRNNPTMRMTLGLETKDEGIYVTDIVKNEIDLMLLFCQQNNFTERRLYIIVEQLNNFEMIIKDILQYYHYFIRPDFRQKPDIEIATESYKEIADKATMEELKKLVGKNHMIDFEALGKRKLDFQDDMKEEEDDTRVLSDSLKQSMDQVEKESGEE